MSRTREISGIVTRTSGIGDKAVYQFIENGQSQGIYEKAKLIIELPSPRITISEDDIDKAFIATFTYVNPFFKENKNE